jgi:hypothetical protein
MGNGDFEIAAGSVLGLNEGAILTVRQGDKRYETELRVSRVVDPFRSVVTSMGTASKVTLLIDQPVDMELVSWPPPSEANLRVWLGPSTPSEELTRAVQTANEFADWVTDQLEDSTYAVFWTGDAWVLRSASGEVLDASEDLRSIFNLASKHSASKQPFIYFNFPPSEELTRTLEIGPGSENSAVELESDLALANYRLLGRMSDGRIEYAWRRTTVESAKELRSPLPEQSVWVSWQEKDTKDAARKLQDFLSRAGKLRAWLQMESPPPDHPYELTLVRASGESMSEPELYDGEVFGLHVKVRDDSPKRPVSGTWLYVIVIDSYGNGSLLYPSLEGRRGFADIRPTSLDDITLPGLYRVTGPFGIDTYVLVSSSEELPDPQVLSFQGNLTRGSSPRTPLGDILSTVGSPQRVQHRDAPPDWSLQHLFVRTKPNQK